MSEELKFPNMPAEQPLIEQVIECAKWVDLLRGAAKGMSAADQADSGLADEAQKAYERLERLLSRPAPAVQVPEDIGAPDGWERSEVQEIIDELAASSSSAFLSGDYSNGEADRVFIHRAIVSARILLGTLLNGDFIRAAAPAPATVATEAVAQEPSAYLHRAKCANGVIFKFLTTDGEHYYEDGEIELSRTPLYAKPVAQGGGVDVEKIMGLVEEHGALKYRDGTRGAKRWPHDTKATLREIRALLSASPAGVVRPDCGTCANRGRIDGLSQETHCEHCCWQESWRTDHYAPAIAKQSEES